MIPLGQDNWARVETVRKVLPNTLSDPSKQGQTSRLLNLIQIKIYVHFFFILLL